MRAGVGSRTVIDRSLFPIVSGCILLDCNGVAVSARAGQRLDTVVLTGCIFGNGCNVRVVIYVLTGYLRAAIGALALVLIGVLVFWVLFSNRLTLASVHPALASSRGFSPALAQTLFTTAIAIIVTLAISWVGLLILNSLLVLPAAASRNIARNLRQYHGFSVLFALVAGIGGLIISYYLGTSAGAAISLVLAVFFAVSFCLRKVRG